jgi:hypothetical protein
VARNCAEQPEAREAGGRTRQKSTPIDEEPITDFRFTNLLCEVTMDKKSGFIGLLEW